MTTKKENKNQNKQEIDDIFIKTNEKKLTFNMTWLMGILKSYLEKTASDKVLCDKAFNITKSSNIMDIDVALLQWFTNCLIKSFSWWY